ncbi:Gfo/Idh/MocA family oxidoreductase [Planctomicrobium piriforme]|uniref:Gfo/Idh/MocA-like oxidoreductase N-terminal domain-containing protein n=1 Tax=Planctomicrobium piriforme TaxID=1576369 RepID=A0A1I3JZ98_9PLAN|nr:hypothetical protein [Planctomicrobium piriforme]SFI65265.1 hypothetical protein SAMN05421753_11158 [Planctomicrobium piriforme]
MAVSEVKLGLIGTGAGTTGSVSDALKRQPRLRLIEVYDACIAAAQTEAQQLEAAYSPSLDGLLRRTSGVIVANVKWMGAEPLVRAAGLQRPALILAPVFCRFTQVELRRLQHFAELTRTLMMPELTYRWARSTLRLRELTATKLQGIEQMEIVCRCEPDSNEELMIYDWCSNVVQSECLQVRANSTGGEVRLQYRRLQQSGNPVSIFLRFEKSDPLPAFPILDAQITCRTGSVRISGEVDLSWQITGNEQSECLRSDRTPGDLMYDLFGRRLVGGVVPVPDVTDLIRATAVRDARRTSQATQTDAIP